MSLESNADLYRRVGALLALWGWGEFLDWYRGWATRTNGSAIRTPSAVTIHHTGGTATPTSYLVNPTDRPELVVLANIHVDALERRIRFIAAGSSSHGGYTHKPCYDRVVAGTAPLNRDLVPGRDYKPPNGFSINTYTVGIEVDGAGGANEWDDWTLRAAVAVSTAIHIVSGWPLTGSPRVGAHKEHTTRKTGDPFINMGTFRRHVLDCAASPWAPPAVGSAPKLGSRVLSKKVGEDVGPDVAELAQILIGLGYDVGVPLDVFGPKMDAAVRDIQKRACLPETGRVDADTLTVILGQQNPSNPDGGDGEPPVVVEPEPTTTTTTTTAAVTTTTTTAKPVADTLRIRVATMNCLDPNIRQGDPPRLHRLTQTRIRGLGRAAVSAAADFHCWTECPDATSDALRPKLRGGAGVWKVWERGAQRIAFNSEEWDYSEKPYDVPWGYHGGLIAVFTHRKTGRKVTIGVYHLRPDSTTPKSEQKAFLKKFLAEMRRHPGVRIIGGDGINDVRWASGWVDARTAAVHTSDRDTPTYRGRFITDRLFVDSKTPVVVWGYGVRDTAAGSDHDAPVMEVVASYSSTGTLVNVASS